MADRSRLPDKNQLDKLYHKILGPDEEMDEATARAILEDHGLTPEEAIEDVRVSLEQEVQSLRAKGADVPPTLLQALASLKPSEEDNRENITIDPDTWVNDLLDGRMPGNVAGANQPPHLHAFRDLDMESLSEEDQQILERLASELEDKDERGEG